MESVQTSKTFRYVWPCDSMRKADIVFEWSREKDRFVFDHCLFSGVNKGCYDRDDWEFLFKLSGEIMALDQREAADSFCERKTT